MLDTKELENELQKAKDLEAFVNAHREDLTHQSLPEYLNSRLREKGLSKADIIAETGLDNSYVYKIFNGTKTRPDRDKLLLLALALKLNIAETNYLLKYNTERELYARDMRDDIIAFGLKKGATTVEVEETLAQFGLKSLSD